MKHIVPNILKNKLAAVQEEIVSELISLIEKMQEHELKDTGYKFDTYNFGAVIIREVLIDEDGDLSFDVEEYFDDDFGAKFTISADEIETDTLLKLYSAYYSNNINTLKAIG